MKKLLLFIATIFLSLAGVAQPTDTTLWVTDGDVYTMETDGNTLYIGGDFTYVGPNLPHANLFDPNTGERVPGFPKFNNYINKIIPDGSGGWYVSGGFTKIGNISRKFLAQIDANGHLTPWNPNPDSVVTNMLLSGNKLYVAGVFSNIGGQPRNRIACVNANTGLATSWNPNPGTGAQIQAMLLHGNKMYIGGQFVMMNSVPRNNIAAVDTVTGVPFAWNPNASGMVNSLAASGSRLYVGGNFISIAAVNCNRIAAIDTAVSAAYLNWPSLYSYGANNIVYYLKVGQGVVYAAGAFSSVGGASRHSVAMLDSATGAATSWDPSQNSPLFPQVHSMLFDGPTIYMGGAFTVFGGQPRNGVVAVDSASGTVTNWDAKITGGAFISSLQKIGSNILVGGDYTMVAGEVRNNIAAIDMATGGLTTWNPDANDRVECLVLSNSKLYVGGRFTIIGGAPRNRVAAMDKVTGLVTNWNPSATPPTTNPCSVKKIVPYGNVIFLGGDFRSVNGTIFRDGLATVDTVLGTATAWFPSPFNSTGSYPGIDDIVIYGSRIYVAGQFDQMGGMPRLDVAAFDLATGNLLPWNPSTTQINENVERICPVGDKVYVSGFFSNFGGAPRTNFACVDSATGVPTPWSPILNIGTYDSPVLFYENGGMYIGGDFHTVNNQTRTGAAFLDTLSGQLAPWSPDLLFIAGGVRSMVTTVNGIYIGGSFSKASGWPSMGLVKVSPSAYNTISGKIFYDVDSDGVQDAGEPGLNNAMLHVQPGNHLVPSSGGWYNAYTDSGSYTIIPVLPLYASGSSPSSHSANFAGYQLNDTANNFAITMLQNVKDLSVDLTNLTAARPGFPVDYMVTYKNNGTVLQSGSVKLVKASELIYTGAYPAPVLQQADSLEWTFSNLVPGESRNILVNFQVPGSVTLLGDTLLSYARVEPVPGDTLPADNTDTLRQVVTGSYDPNDKTVIPQGTDSVGYVSLTTDKLTYIVRFQNTGTDTAFTVVIRDTLDTDLDLPTFTMLSASHDYTFSIQNRVVTWTFSNILLPDSNVNEPASHGFVKYFIKPLPNPSPGTVITNTAYIYFDYNPPVITNTAITTYFNDVSIDEAASIVSPIKIYPNPFTNTTTIEISNTENCTCEFILYDQLGRVVEKLSDIKGQRTGLSRKNMKSGMYYYVLRDKDGEVIGKGKVVVQ